jgi:hypothetical protein
MEAPRCFICGHRHWSTRPHVKPADVAATLTVPVPGSKPRNAITVTRNVQPVTEPVTRNEDRNAPLLRNEPLSNAERQTRYRRRKAHMRHR